MIEYISEGIAFTLPEQESVSNWLLLLVKRYGRSIGQLTYVFVSDEYLLKMNQEHLGHDYYTDIITFPLQEEARAPLVADFFISIDRVKENAERLQVRFEDELHRVMVHGLLHLLGYEDHTEGARTSMRAAEDEALSLKPGPEA